MPPGYADRFARPNFFGVFLDLIYKLAVPLSPPACTFRLADRIFPVFSFELKQTFQALSDQP